MTSYKRDSDPPMSREEAKSLRDFLRTDDIRWVIHFIEKGKWSVRHPDDGTEYFSQKEYGRENYEGPGW